MSITLSGILNVRYNVTGTPAGATSVSFTPQNNCLLVVCIRHDDNTSLAVTAGTTLSGGGLSWTKNVGFNADADSGGSGYYSIAEIWTAEVVTGSSMTLTWARASGARVDASASVTLQVVEVRGYKTTSYVGATMAEDSVSNGAKTGTLSGSPLSDSLVIGARSGSPPGTNDISATPTAGWTELYDIPVGNYSGYALQQIQYDLTPSGTSVSWDDVAVTESFINSCVTGIEIKAQPLSERLIFITHW
jgi:hypothetical protein